jgi:ATP-binding cassette subfamily F protein 3
MLTINELTYRIAGRTLLEKTSVSIAEGQRVGLVGPNGAGKSTLFKLISGELQPDDGDINIISRAKIGMVRQDLPEDETTLIDIVLAADTERAALLKEAETAEDPDRIGYIYDRLEQIGAYEAPSRAETILAGLGFDDKAQNTGICNFSGGWRMRVALAAALFQQPDFLLLDEPTNHLDFEAMVWLENYLMKYDKTLLIISHDRDILNKTVTHILHLENKKLTSYTGNYDWFERRRAEKMLNQQALHERQMAQKAHMMQFVERFKAKASKARQAQSRLKMIEKMDIVDAVIADRVASFTFPQPTELRSPMITLENVDIGYEPHKPILKKLSLRIDADDRIALLGANGNGKSTLIKLLSDTLQPLAGKVEKSGKMKIGYFAQHQSEELDLTQTPFEKMRETMGDKPEPKVRAALDAFGFDRHRADTKIGELSGGEKARLLLAVMSYDAPHILLLDEPTNHLDIEAREALTQALNNYNGCVILVSHDPHLVASVADRLWLVQDGKCINYEDDLEGYRNLIMQQRKKERAEARKAGRDKGSNDDAPAKVKISQKELQKLEAEIEQLTKERDTLEVALANAASGGQVNELKDLNSSLQRANDALAKAEERWLEVQED